MTTRKRTEFASWVSSMGYTQTAAARRLGISLSRVKDLCTGYSASRGDRAYPDLTQRMAMTALAKRLRPYPLPDNCSSQERLTRLALAAAERALEPWPVEPLDAQPLFSGSGESEAPCRRRNRDRNEGRCTDRQDRRPVRHCYLLQLEFSDFGQTAPQPGESGNFSHRFAIEPLK